MKKLLGILVLGLLLSNCGAGMKHGNEPFPKSNENYVARAYLIAKDNNKDPNIWFWGYGDTRELAKQDVLEACRDYSAEEMSKDLRLNYEKGCAIEKAKPTKKHRRRLIAERRAEIIKQSYMAKIESKKQECATIGFKPGTEKMAECILRLLEMEGNEDIARRAREQEAWKTLLFGGMLTGSGTTTSNTSSGGAACFKSSETTSGTGKICYYNCMGTTRALNITSMQICPLSANF